MDYLLLNQKIKLPTKVAITEKEKSRGLMHVNWPPPIMAFPFSNSQVRKFWMKDTPSPLDVLFCRAGKIIAVEQGEPFSEKYFGPHEESDLVVELPSGMANKLSLQKNQEVKLCWSISSLAKKFAYDLNCTLIKKARIDVSSKFSYQIKEIENLINYFIKNNKIKEKKEYSVGFVEFPFNGEIIYLEIIVTSNKDLKVKGGFNKSFSDNESDNLLINLAAFKPEEFHSKLSIIINHELTHFIDLHYAPEQNVLFTEDEFDVDKQTFSQFYYDFLKLYKNYIKKYKLKSKEVNFKSFEDEIKYFVIKCIKTNDFQNLLSRFDLKLDQNLIGKLLKFIERNYVEDMNSFYVYEGNILGLFDFEKSKERQEAANKDYFNSKTELKAHLNQIIEEIESGWYNVVDFREMITNFNLQKLLQASQTFLIIKKYLYPENLQWMEKEIAIYFQSKFSKKTMKERSDHFGINLSERDELMIRYLRFLMENNKEKFQQKIQDSKFVAENKNAIKYLAQESKMFSELAEVKQNFPN